MTRVLFVDDDEYLLEVTKVFQERHGRFRIETVTSAVQALDRLEKENYDVIVADFLMPEMTGIELLRQMKARGIDTPFILFTGKGREEVAIDALNNGATFYLQKGGDPRAQFAELAHMIEEAARRKKAEEDLAESEERYRLLCQHANDAVFVHEITRTGPGAFLEVNDRACQLYGYTREEFLSISPRELDVPEQRDRDPAIMQQLLSSHHVIFEAEQVTRTGERFLGEMSIRLLELGGRPVILALVRDITERRKAEQALRTSETLFRSVVETSLDVISMLDANGTITYESPSTEQVLGYRAGARVGSNVFDYVHPEDRAVIAESFRALLVKPGKTVTPVFRFRHENGSWVHLEAVGNNLLANPHVGKIVVNFRDVSERVRTEQRIRESEERYRLVVEHANEGIVVAQDGRLKFFNRKLVEFTGFEQKTLMERPFTELIHPEDQAMVMEEHGRRLRGENPLSVYRFRIIDHRGKIHWVQNNSVAFLWEGRAASLNFIMDITERMETKEALEVSEEKYRNLFNKANDAIILAEYPNGNGQGGRILEVNEVACRELGYSRDELCDRSEKDVRMRCLLPNSVEAVPGNGHVVHETALPCRNGREIPYEVSSHVFNLGKERVILSIARDITERKIQEEIEKTAFLQIQQNINQLAILGDHIRNPLAVIVALADLDGSETSLKILHQAEIIDNLITRLDKGWIESESVKEFVRRHYS